MKTLTRVLFVMTIISVLFVIGLFIDWAFAKTGEDGICMKYIKSLLNKRFNLQMVEG